MKLNIFCSIVLLVAVPFTVHSQITFTPEYGTLSTAPNTIAFSNDATAGDFVVLNVADNNGYVLVGAVLEDAGATGYLGGNNWLVGMTSNSSTNAGDVFLLDAGNGTIGNPIANVNDVRDLAVIEQGSRYDVIVADRANDAVHLISDVLGSPSTTEITPSAIAGNVGIQGLVALNESLYFLYDELPDAGFGSDELIVVEGITTAANTTRLSWNDIGSAGAGLSTDELSVDFHNGLAVRQPDENTIVMYLSNFGTFSNNKIIEVTWNNSGRGFDFSSPSSTVLFTENDLYNAIADNNGAAEDPLEFANSRGVAVLPGETVSEDQLVIWVDDSGNSNTYMLLYDFTSSSFSLFGSDALEAVVDPTTVQDWMIMN